MTSTLRTTRTPLYPFWLWAACIAPALAAGETPPPPPEAAASAPAPSPAPPPPRKFEGALGVVMYYRPAFGGSSDFKARFEPAGFLRYGRWTLTLAGGFTTRRQDAVDSGLSGELLRRENLRMSFSLRNDGGRNESDSTDLAGMGDIPRTVRGRLSVRWNPAPLWDVSAAASFDALNRVGGTVLTAGVGRAFPIDERQRVSVGLTLNAADARYMQAWYGVTPEQSAASGYAPYTPGAGLRDVGLGASYRIEITPQWAAFVGGGVSRQLGPAADSPLTRRASAWGLSSGIARRF